MPPSDDAKTFKVEKHYELRLPGWLVPKWVLRRLGQPQRMQRTLAGSEVEYHVEREFRIGSHDE